MKHTAVFLVLLALLALPLQAAAAEETTVTVTIAVEGVSVLQAVEVTVTDADGDGALTVSDALYAAHQAAYEGGAQAGFEAYIHKDYGLSLGKLWGNTSGNFGYYVNHASAWGLSDPVKDGDVLDAFVYADGKYFSDQYTFFETSMEDGVLTLTLLGAGYDAEWNPVTAPIAGAVITLNGTPTEVTTDENGKATLTLEPGEWIVSATVEGKTLVPPVCRVAVQDSVPAGDHGVLLFAGLFLVSCALLFKAKKLAPSKASL